MNLDAFDFDLPPDRIAQEPASPRDASRLLVLDRASGALGHRTFRDLPEELRAGDLLVFNDTKVIPARLHGTRPGGGKIEMLLVEPLGAQLWRALLRGSGRVAPGATLRFPGGLVATPRERDGEAWRVELSTDAESLEALLDREGEVPLPPYIRREGSGAAAEQDRIRYQTIYARVPGAVAAPTAGLHFTDAVLAALEARGVERAFLTLHVGPGTFAPVRTERIEDHRLHEEAYDLPDSVAEAIVRARAAGGRIVAVGTTAARTLESRATDDGRVTPGRGRTGLFIYPGFRFRVVDALVTNFHLPRSTLLMLVSALAGTDRVLAAYREAVRSGYRFYSYGDAMLVRPA
ncbi:MAG TPA: tRNA preQ1(34) S-adenosylmethionine ribosyltransferase-isomerase QueA [Candidatus Polarisedimenticolaceae bacterium]|nr:tRNA preQ1(34) S-adenosylmethionine ribosyltransferase-isomerase QueA [Candidatus Polarisedimenticolaceae bacterium]